MPETYSFWDLHAAIQDAMGWLDYDLHEFRLLDAAGRQVVSIGIPTDDDPEDRTVVPGWGSAPIEVLRSAELARATSDVRV